MTLNQARLRARADYYVNQRVSVASISVQEMATLPAA